MATESYTVLTPHEQGRRINEPKKHHAISICHALGLNFVDMTTQ